jgi:hypothetical protein
MGSVGPVNDLWWYIGEPPAPPTSESFNMGAALRTAMAYGPVPDPLGAPPISALLVRNADLAVPVADFERARDRRWQEQLNEAGSGSLVVQNDDPDLAEVQDGDVVRFELYGWAAFSMLIRERDQITVDPSEEAGQATTLSGPGTLARLDTAVVYPSRGVDVLPIEEDRVFNWTAPDYDDSEWISPFNLAYWNDSTPAWYGMRAGWPNNSGASWMGPQGSTVQLAPGGNNYFRSTFNVDGSPGQVLNVVVYAVADDTGIVYIDGQKVVDLSQWGNLPSDVKTGNSTVTPGTHVCAVQVYNSEAGTMLWEGGPFNPTGLLLDVRLMNPDGTAGNSLLQSGVGTWKLAQYPPEPPGMTPGEVLRHLVDEAQARGALGGLTLAFTDDTDSDGRAWPIVGDIGTKVGTDYLTFLRELTGTYVDVWMEPAGWRLWAWLLDGRGADVPVTLERPTDPTDPTTGNLRQLTHKAVL